MSATAELRIPTGDEFADALERGALIFAAADTPKALAAAFGADCLALWELAKGVEHDAICDVVAGEVPAEAVIRVIGTDALLLGIAIGRELYQ